MVRNQRSYTEETRMDALELAKRIGNRDAAEKLRIPLDTLYTWISKEKTGRLPQALMPSATKKAITHAERIKELEQENRRLGQELSQIRKENQILEDAAAFFASRRKKSGSS